MVRDLIAGVLSIAAAVAFGVQMVSCGSVKRGAHADTEASTNCPIGIARSNVRHLTFALELAGTPSNNVQVAFGRDANENGVLDLDEVGMDVGWDCGEWVMRRRTTGADTNAWRAVSVTTNRVKKLDFDLQIAHAKARRIVSSENGQSLRWDFPKRLPPGLYDNLWDMVRLTVRGKDAAEESFRAQVRTEGLKVIVR